MTLTLITKSLAASWRKRLGARLPPLGSRVRVSVTPCGFRGVRSGVWVVFIGVSPGFPCHKFHSSISPHSSHSFSFISSALVMVCQAWSASTLATHGPIIWGFIASHSSTRPCVGHELRIFIYNNANPAVHTLNIIPKKFGTLTVNSFPSTLGSSNESLIITTLYKMIYWSYF